MKNASTTMKLGAAALALALLALLAPARALAQAPDEKLAEIEKQVRTLKQTVDELRRAPASGDAPAIPTNAPPAAVSTATNAPPAPVATATNLPPPPPPEPARQTKDPIAQIREEGMEHSQAIEILSYLTDVIGPRLTASPNHKRANEWTRDKLAAWGLTNAHLEALGPFGRGWSLKRFSAQVVEPQCIPLAGYPSAWSPGFDDPITADVVYFDARNDADLEKFKGKLKGAIVLSGGVREVPPHFQPLARRLNETNLLQLANASPPRSSGRSFGRSSFEDGAPPAAGPGRRPPSASEGGEQAATTNTTRSASAPAPRRGPRGGFQFPGRFLPFLVKEGVALVVNPSSQGDGGTLFVAAASVPRPEPQGTNAPMSFSRLSPWATNAPPIPPQITLATEDYNRLVRMIQQGEKLRMAVDLRVQFHNDDLMAYNTVAEIPGTDRKKEIVMLGGHLDSWHAGTGATDDAVGVAAAMEAVRILRALDLKPRRTIRIGLWAGEEQGFLGSRAYVSNHFGYYTTVTNTGAVRSPRDQSSDRPGSRSVSASSRSTRKLVRKPEYARFSAYFNLDNGAGKIRGIHLQGNEALRPLFRGWLEPFRDLGAETLALSNTGGTDHIPFDAVGLPGFQFIQDPLDYMSRTHHSNADVFDRIQPDDLKQAAVILAAFVYDAAMLDKPLPRKPVE